MASVSTPPSAACHMATQATQKVTSSISKTSRSEDLKALRQLLHQGIDDLLQELGSHGRDPPSSRPCTEEEVFATPVGTRPRRGIVRTCEKIISLVQGPMWWMMQSTGGSAFPAVLDTALELKLHHIISVDRQSPTSLADLEKESGGSRELISRLLRYLSQRFVFEEVFPGQYAHNANSSILLIPGIEALMGTCSDDILRANAALPMAMKENSFQIPETNKNTAFSKAFQTDLSMFDYLYQKEPDRAQRFAKAMTPWMTFSYVPSKDLYPFRDLRPGAIVVDVGGGSGHVSAEIAKLNPQLKFVVQDFEEPLAVGRSTYKNSGLPIEWQVHNAFQPQPVKRADVYLTRRLLHDHSDTDAAIILRMIAGAMDERSRILIEDMISPDLHGEESEWFVNHADIVMLACLNAKERSLAQWNMLVKKADERLEIARVWGENGETTGYSATLEIRLDL